MEAFLKSGKVNPSDDASSSKQSLKKEEKKGKKPTPWVEKYRPRTVDDIVEQNEIVATLKQCLQGADLPHFLFYGPPGTGKTSTIIAAARQLFGDMYKDRILELNASDDRGIQVIRDKVKTFSQLSVSSTRPDGKPCPPFKIVILDEADSMTHAAQAALRRTMEKETKSTRFCLICNYVSCIIQPLTSRCAKYRFKPLSKDTMLKRLKLICDEEKVSCDEKALQTLVDTSGGDLRRAITCLQSCARLKGEEGVLYEDVLEVTGVIPDKYIENLFDVCKARNFDKAEIVIEEIISSAYCAPQVLDQFQDLIIAKSNLTDVQKATICEKISVCAWRLQEGASEYLQLLDLACAVINVF
ncbi:replication factor C subunit 4 [Planococcus citri]|uniref:replication factor C subunit 4 n=1 Tax=Planococcus citri TaxID=170843 RepID=UPI0031FA0E17